MFRNALVSVGVGFVAFWSATGPARAEPFTIDGCVSRWTKEVDKPFRVPLEQAKRSCQAISVSVEKLKVQLLGTWRRVDENGKIETRTFDENGTVTLRRQQRSRSGRFTNQIMTMPYEVVNYDDRPGNEDVSIDGSLHTIKIQGNRMHEYYKPASAELEYHWTRVPQVSSAIPVSSSSSSISNLPSRLCNARMVGGDVDTCAIRSANGREGPSTSYPVRHSFRAGEKVFVDGVMGDWCVAGVPDPLYIHCSLLMPPPGGWSENRAVTRFQLGQNWGD